MPEPQIESTAQEFARFYDTLTLPDERESVKRAFAERTAQVQTEPGAYELLLRTGDLIGEDMTNFLFQRKRVDPISPEQAIQQIEQAKQGVPWYRRGISKVAGAAEWWQENVTEPSTATVFASAFKLIPGQQEFEHKMEDAQTRITAERGLERQAGKLGPWIEAATEAWRETDTVWGFHTAAELVFDPLNLVGIGIPGKVMKVIPALKPVLFPLHAIDRAPDVVVRKTLGAGASFVSNVTGLKELRAPHLTTQVTEVERRVRATASGAFSPAKIEAGIPADTADVFSNLTRFPDDATPYSLRNIMNHVAEEFADSPAGVKGWENFHDKLKSLPPAAATEFLSGFVGELEKKALVKGGRRITGEVVEGTLRQRRVKTIGGMLERLALDEQVAKGFAEAIDDKIYLLWDSIWLRKLEPMVVRPWAIAHLAFAGFFFMNVLEDVAVATIGMSGLGRRGFSDKEFQWLTAGLPDVPQDLLTAERQSRLLMDTGPDLYKQPVSEGVLGVAKKMVLWPVTVSSKAGWAIRRSAWTNKYFKEFDLAIREAGVTPEEIGALRDFVQTELPDGLQHLRDEIGLKTWTAATTGNPQAVRDLKDTMTSTRIIQKAQMDLIAKFPESPTDVRRALQDAIVNEGGIRPDNVERVRTTAQEKLLDWHKYSSASIRARYDDFIQALSVQPPTTPAGGMSLITMIQHTMDDLAQLPREINAHARVKARQVAIGERSKIWDEAFEAIDEGVGGSRQQLETAMARAKPIVERLLAQTAKTPAQHEAVQRSIDDIFAGYRDISENLRETWTNYRTQKNELFASTPREERGDWFWLQLDSIGGETWAAEYEFRAGASNRAREGWNALLGTLPPDLAGKDREFIKQGVEAALNDADESLNKLRLALQDTEEALLRDPEALTVKHQQRIARLQEMIAVTARQRGDLATRMEKLAKPRRATTPAELLVYDRNIRIANRALKDAREHGLTDRILEIQRDIDDLASERISAFEGFIPVPLRPEWEALKATQDRLLQKLPLETTSVGQGAVKSELRRVTARINKFQRGVERGEAVQEVEKITGFTERTVTQAADSLVREGGAPDTLDDMVARLDAMAGAGDEAAQRFNESLETVQTQFGAPDIAAQVEAEPVVGRVRVLSKTRADAISTQLSETGEAVISIRGENALEQATAGEARYVVNAFPERQAQVSVGDTDAIRKFATDNQDVLRKRNHYINASVEEDQVSLRVAVAVESRDDAMRLASLREQTTILDAASNQIIPTEEVVTPLMEGRQQAYERLFSRATELSQVPNLAPRELDLLRRASTTDLTPTGDLVNLVNNGFLEAPIRLKSGKWRTKLTPEGQATLERRATDTRDIGSLTANLDAPIREADTVIEAQMDIVDKQLADALKLWDNPPLRTEQEATLNSYFGRVADYLDKRTDLTGKVTSARGVAAKRTTDEYNRWFINYDNRTTLDFFMQRFMPFWMYESRRWPRLLSIAAKRPVLAKHFTMAGGDWDYGYSPTPFGFEFNPMKGTIASGARRVLSRDFPELHSGYRGRVEQGFDWFARGGFYFNPLITSANSLLQEEPGAIAPPPVSLILHSMAAAGVELPAPLRQIAFDSRYTDFLIDQVIANRFDRNPGEVRNLAENDDEDAIALLYLAEKEAAARMVAINQSSVLRYRPETRREFGEDFNEAVERIVGIPQDVLEEAQRLGISYSELAAISGPQRRALREAVPNFDAQVSASISFRPLEEQQTQRKTTAFWSAIETSREDNRQKRQELSDRWQEGFVNRPLEDLSELNRERGIIFNAVHSLPEFRDVPINMEDRLAYLQKFGRPAPLIHPVDEALEAYYSVSTDNYIDARTGDINWGDFFDARQEVIDNFGEPIREIVQSEIQRSETELERTLEVFSPLLRQYFGIRSTVMDQLEQADPATGQAHVEYRRLMNLAQRASNPQESLYLERQARSILATNPQLSLAEAIVRRTRQRMRIEDPDMERAYQMFIARPSSIPTPTAIQRSSFQVRGPTIKFR